MAEPILILSTAFRWFAYIDPGTGQVVLYALAAAGMSIMFKARQLKEWIASKFSRGNN